MTDPSRFGPFLHYVCHQVHDCFSIAEMLMYEAIGLAPHGKGADVAKHCVPAVSGERVSITFRKMRSVTLGSKKRTVEYKGPDCAPPAVDFRVRA